MAATPTTMRTAATIPRLPCLWTGCPTALHVHKIKKNKKLECHCYGMLNSNEIHCNLQQIRRAFHFWMNLISKNCEWLLLMMLEWINAILTLLFGERG